MKPRCLRFVASFALWLAGLAAQPAVPIVIQNARVVPVKGAALEKGSVVVHEGRIVQVGASVNIPAGAWIIDGQGLTVYPGFTDALSTWGMPEASSSPAAGGAGGRPSPAAPQARVRGPEDRPNTFTWVKAEDLVQPSDRRLPAARNAGFTTAVTFPKQGILAGHGAVVSLAGETPGRMVVQPSVALYGSVSGAGRSFPGSLMGVMAYIRQLWMDAGHYQLAKALYEKSPQTVTRPEYDRALEGVLGARRLLLPAVSKVQIDRMAKFGAELKLPVVLYGGHEGFRAAESMKKYAAALIVNVKWPEKPREADPEDEDSLRELITRDRAPSTPAELVKAGVPFAFTSDGLASPRDLLRGVKKAITAGLKPEDAIRALTLTPAEIYGVADRLGSIEPGKAANLTVFRGDPFDEKSKLEMVFIEGVKYLPTPEAPAAPPGGSSRPPAAGAASLKEGELR